MTLMFIISPSSGSFLEGFRIAMKIEYKQHALEDTRMREVIGALGP